MQVSEQLTSGKPGQVFELEGTWYTIVENKYNKLLGQDQVKLYPQPVNLDEEWYHYDGKLRVCRNNKCPNLVKRSKNDGVQKYYCNRRCAQQAIQRRYWSAQGSVGTEGQRDVFGRLYTVRNYRTGNVSPGKAKDHLDAHRDDKNGRCPEANEDSGWRCPGLTNDNSMSKAKWENWHMTGPWPGACLIYAALKDNRRQAIYEDAGQPFEREDTIGRGATWRWKDEEEMLPFPEGIVRP